MMQLHSQFIPETSPAYQKRPGGWDLTSGVGIGEKNNFLLYSSP